MEKILLKPQKLWAELKSAEEQLKRMKERTISTTRTLNSLPSGARNVHSRFDALIIAEDYYEKKLEEYCEAYQTALNLCVSSQYAAILIDFYLNGKKIKEIAENMNYCERNIGRLKKKAVEELTQIMIR